MSAVPAPVPASLVALPRLPGDVEPPADVVARVCAERGVDVAALRDARRRSRWITDTRRAIAHALRARGMAAREIASVLGLGDHTSALYLCRTRRTTR